MARAAHIIRGGIVLALCVGLVSVSACGKRNKKTQLEFDGVNFRTTVSKVDKDREHFNVVVRNATQTLEGAREAGRYQATRYCIENFGTSKIDWVAGPDDENPVMDGADLLLEGYCTP